LGSGGPSTSPSAAASHHSQADDTRKGVDVSDDDSFTRVGAHIRRPVSARRGDNGVVETITGHIGDAQSKQEVSRVA